MENINKRFEEDWISLSRIVDEKATLKEICELFWLKGRCAGLDAGLEFAIPSKPTLTPEDEAKLASVTIGERFNHEHYGQVLEAQKHQ
ncbi:MAG TPA: hypothetical protein VIX17_11705 [Pyrinomonadaceae bacterium]|jgi:hypothetical protein